jgi:hypothetical protein
LRGPAAAYSKYDVSRATMVRYVVKTDERWSILAGVYWFVMKYSMYYLQQDRDRKNKRNSGQAERASSSKYGCELPATYTTVYV